MPITVTPLGAGQDVGRSCILVRIHEKVVMLDCGMHMGYKDDRRYPDFTLISSSLDPVVINNLVDVVVISHYHLDHCGALPYFTEKIGYSGPIIMTYPTKAVSPVLLADCCKVMEQKNILSKLGSDINTESTDILKPVDPQHFSVGDVWKCMEKVTAIQLHQTISVNGINITPYYAGHVLGASMFHVEVGNESIVYTGDYNMVRDRHLGPASIKKLFPDVLLSESTYATYIRPSRRSTERVFCEMILQCLEKGGKVLIPVFAVGRAQELCILLEFFWRRMQLRYPIYFGGAMTEKSSLYYQLYTNWTNTALSDDLFSFPHVLPYDRSVLTNTGPAVLFATPGMLHAGLSLQAFKCWAPDPNNLTIIPGFCVAGTLGARIIAGAKRITLDPKDPSSSIDIRCDVKYLSFSSHADSIGIQSLIQHVEPDNIVFLHGERQGMLSMASFVQEQFQIPTFCPHNGSTVIIPIDNLNISKCLLSSTVLNSWILHKLDNLLSHTSLKSQTNEICHVYSQKIELAHNKLFLNSYEDPSNDWLCTNKLEVLIVLLLRYYLNFCQLDSSPINCIISLLTNLDRNIILINTENEILNIIRNKTSEVEFTSCPGTDYKTRRFTFPCKNKKISPRFWDSKASKSHYNLPLYILSYSIKIQDLPLPALLCALNGIKEISLRTHKKCCSCFKDITSSKLNENIEYSLIKIRESVTESFCGSSCCYHNLIFIELKEAATLEIMYKSMRVIAKIPDSGLNVDLFFNILKGKSNSSSTQSINNILVTEIDIKWSYIDETDDIIKSFVEIIEESLAL
ncbi:RNA-metabolising metallo-beta-lactamase family protein [Cryptosporidium andersoni]|uniref:RNA-metabolising metallo-beta-lactamase family protein n=1 Tax=Cryptosporidium andersoni TaxID=117008 RepID=A0A1J4MVB5_9CRYT|nr:RNA-metabolising metallo-beta-lactamase family protein [Cryptosporidium andersoni]